MKLEPNFQPPSAPFLKISRLPVEEQTITRSIDLNLGSLANEAANVAACIALFGMCRENGARDLFGDWMRVAARDGAMSIRNFAEALASVRSLIGRVKTWLPLIDGQALRSAEALFERKFPFAHKMRHSVAHPEFYNDPTKKMGFSGDLHMLGIKAEGVGNLVIINMISDFTFASTFEGAIVKYDLTAETLETIITVVKQAFGAFSALEAHTVLPPRHPKG